MPNYTGIFTPGNTYYFNDTIDFNAYFGIPPSGGTVEVPAGTYGELYIHTASNIKLINVGGQAVFDYISFGNGTLNMEIDGLVEAPTTPYGFKTDNPGYFAGLMQTTGFLKIAGVEGDGQAMGMQISHIPSLSYRAAACDLIVKYNKFANCDNEGLYIGHDSLGGPFITGHIHHNITLNTGRDGIQCRNGTFIVEDNEITNTGLEGNDAHRHGILIGGNTNGSTVRRNTLRLISGNAFFSNGFGLIVFEDNDAECNGTMYGVYTKNYESDTADLQAVGFQTFVFVNNRVEAPGDPYAFVIARDPFKCPVSVYLEGNNWEGGAEWIETSNGVVILTEDPRPADEGPAAGELPDGLDIGSNVQYLPKIFDATAANRGTSEPVAALVTWIDRDAGTVSLIIFPDGKKSQSRRDVFYYTSAVQNKPSFKLVSDVLPVETCGLDVEDLAIDDTNADAFVLSWTLPAGTIEAGVVYREDGTEAWKVPNIEDNKTGTMDGDGMFFTFHDLEVGQDYEFLVVAVCDNGISSPGVMISGTPTPAP